MNREVCEHYHNPPNECPECVGTGEVIDCPECGDLYYNGGFGTGCPHCKILELHGELSNEMDLNAELTAQIVKLEAKWRDYESAMVFWREAKHFAQEELDDLREEIRTERDRLMDVVKAAMVLSDAVVALKGD